MTNREPILTELNELNSNLPASVPETYIAPAGYFEDFAGQVMNRIKALKAANSKEETNHLSGVLQGINNKNSYSVPQGYFDSFAASVLDKIKTTSTGINESREETESISPLLAGLKKENLYSVPEGYFESLPSAIVSKTNEPETKVISITHRKWFRYAAAAVVFGIIALSGVLLFSNNTPKPVDSEKAWAKVEKKVQKISDSEIEKFIQPDSSTEKNTDIASVKIDNKTDVKELVKDISDKDIQNFLDQTSDPDDDDAIFN